MGLKRKTVIHKRHDCIGCASCALIDPKHRTMDDQDGLSCLKNAVRKGNQYMVSQIDEDEIEPTIEAAQACPVNVIVIG